jgi:hypothetical protein
MMAYLLSTMVLAVVDLLFFVVYTRWSWDQISKKNLNVRMAQDRVE